MFTDRSSEAKLVNFLSTFSINSEELGVVGKDVPWGTIYKGEKLDEYTSEIVNSARQTFELEAHLPCSVGLAVMKKGAFHKPYVRIAQGSREGNVDASQNLRIYKVIAGSMIFQRGGNLHEYTPNDSFIAVRDIDPFSFKAGESGCVFVVIDFPPFTMDLDENDPVMK